MTDFDSAMLPQARWESALRKWMSWSAVVGASLLALTFFLGVFYISLFGAWDEIARKHFAAVIGLPCAALTSMFVVIVLRTVAGPIELKIPGFEFRGASGPIVMWIACFLAMTFAISWIWPLQFKP
jgi:hypothetical protein